MTIAQSNTAVHYDSSRHCYAWDSSNIIHISNQYLKEFILCIGIGFQGGKLKFIFQAVSQKIEIWFQISPLKV